MPIKSKAERDSEIAGLESNEAKQLIARCEARLVTEYGRGFDILVPCAGFKQGTIDAVVAEYQRHGYSVEYLASDYRGEGREIVFRK